MYSQITFNGCHPLFDNQDFSFTQVGTDGTGRAIFETSPIDGNQPCSGIGICEFRISWNDTSGNWEFLADDGTGDFSNPFLIYSNAANATPNPPSLALGTWAENNPITGGNCGGDLTMSNATLTGQVQDTTLSTNNLENEIAFSIYPNPVEDILYFKYKNSTIQTVQLYNVLGKLVKQFSNAQSLDVSNLSTGVYFIKLQAEKQEIIKKIIIQ